MDTKEGEDQGEDHTSDTSIKLYLVQVPLDGAITLHDPEDLNNSQDSEQSVQSWKPGKSE